jgi:hypothetical protein
LDTFDNRIHNAEFETAFSRLRAMENTFGIAARHPSDRLKADA